MKSFSLQMILPPVECTGSSPVTLYADLLNYRKCSLLLAITSPPATGEIIIYEAQTNDGTTDQQLNISSYRVIDGVSQTAEWSDASCTDTISIWPGIGVKVFIWVDISFGDMTPGYRYLTLNTDFTSGTIAAVAISYDPIAYTLDNVGATI